MSRRTDLSRLTRGVKFWNAKARAGVIHRADLTNVTLARKRLKGIDLRTADLSNSDLRSTKLRCANLSFATLDDCDLTGADLTGVVARRASFRRAKLNGVVAYGASFDDVDFTDSDLTDAVLQACTFTRAFFNRTNLTETQFALSSFSEAGIYDALMLRTQFKDANLAKARVGGLNVIDVDLSECQGLNRIIHRAPSELTFSTLRHNPNRDIIAFAARCGLNTVETLFAMLWRSGISQDEINDIAYEIARKRTPYSIMKNQLFISYAHSDTPFVDRLQQELEGHGIQCWRDVKDMTVGKMELQIDRAIRLNPTVLLILSAASVDSDWVEWEAATARKIERDGRRNVLCPIALDAAWQSCRWSAPLRQQIQSYHILDFAEWSNGSTFKRQFARLREGLLRYYGDARE